MVDLQVEMFVFFFGGRFAIYRCGLTVSIYANIVGVDKQTCALLVARARTTVLLLLTKSQNKCNLFQTQRETFLEKSCLHQPLATELISFLKLFLLQIRNQIKRHPR